VRPLDRRHVYLACFAAHFLIISAVCCRDTLLLLANGYTACPPSLEPYWRRAEKVVSAPLAEQLELTNPLREVISTYTRSAGIDFGYGFFAPNVPNNFKLVFQIHYPDGRIEYELPHVSTPAAGLRVSTLIDNIAQTRYDPLRELMVKMMAYGVWRGHPDAMMVRAVVGFVTLPNVAEFRQGMSESYQFLYAYDFQFSSAASAPEHR